MFERILVPVDFGPAADQAVSLAVGIAAKFDSNLQLVHAFFIPPIAYADGLYLPMGEILRSERGRLDKMLVEVRGRYPRAEAIWVDGDPRQKILEVAAEQRTDVIVMGTHGRRSLSHALLGSVATRIVRSAPVPVLTTRAPADVSAALVTAFRHILVATDFGEPAQHAVGVALALAARFDAKITLMHAYPLPLTLYDERVYPPTAEIVREAERALDRAVSNAKQQYAQVEAVLARGDARERIVDQAREQGADLVVMGTHHRRGMSRLWLGSVAEGVVRTSPISVLTVSAPGAVSGSPP